MTTTPDITTIIDKTSTNKITLIDFIAEVRKTENANSQFMAFFITKTEGAPRLIRFQSTKPGETMTAETLLADQANRVMTVFDLDANEWRRISLSFLKYFAANGTTYEIS